MPRTSTRPPDLSVVAPASSPAIETLVEEYLTHCRSKGLSPKTINFAYGYPLRGVFLPWCAREGITGPDQVTDRVLERFTVELLEKGGKTGPLAKRSVATYARTTNHFLRWAHQQGEMAAVKAQAPRVPKKLVDVLSAAEIDRLEDAARTERDKLIVRVLGDGGLRLGELVGLRTGDLKEQWAEDQRAGRNRQHFLHVTGKGERDRLVPITPALYRRLQQYIAKYRPRDAGSDYIVLASRRSPHGDYDPLTGSGVNQMINTLAQVAGIRKRVYPHLLRHSFATIALQRGMNPVQLAKILGHSSLTMIWNVYQHLAPQDAHAAMMKMLTEKN